jgi:lipopolysaccharide/colanic/teichoic acid biosynthesis glycosyltransferase/glycosyltransferase involved in cell wall biosynthesis
MVGKSDLEKVGRSSDRLECTVEKNSMISVVIPAYNEVLTLQDCLKALALQTRLPDEVIVVDDGSSDETVLAINQPGVKVIQQSHQGPAAARNLGAREACGDIILFTDADCQPDREWVAQMAAPFSDPQVMGVKGTYRCRETGLVPRFVQQEYESKYVRMIRQTSIDFIDTYSAGYRREVFLQNEGFEPALMKLQDQEFSFRLARKGYRLLFIPQAIVYHRHDINLGEYMRRKFGIGYWKAFMLHWLPEKTFNDSHTLPSQRWQILLLGVILTSLVLSFFWSHSLWLALAGVILFYGSDFSFLIEVWKRDRPVFWAAPGLLLARTLALGAGLGVGFLFPPKTHRRQSAGLVFGQRALKRMMDVALALVGVVISFPILLVAGIAIKLNSPGPVFFSQMRCGENGRPFRILKLRTMVVGAGEQLDQVLKQNHLKGPVFKVPNDPRVTGVGRFLRRWSLDELPQLWNVLRGEMSLVGPRPEETWVAAQYNDYQRQRLLFKPGLTGPMQVLGRGDLDLETRLSLELDYIQHYSVWKDLKILLKTIPAIISGQGAY